MSAPLTELLPDDVVRAIADEVWYALLEDFLVPAEPSEVPAPEVSASVVVRGPWSGLVALTCSTAAAEALTRSLLHLGGDEPVLPEDVEDAFGELANVIGGNVKAVLPGPSTLGLPSVGAPVPDGAPAQTCRVDALWHEHPLSITVHAAAGIPAPRLASETPATPATDEKDEVPL